MLAVAAVQHDVLRSLQVLLRLSLQPLQLLLHMPSLPPLLGSCMGLLMGLLLLGRITALLWAGSIYYIMLAGLQQHSAANP
jgi:hypothetical protein